MIKHFFFWGCFRNLDDRIYVTTPYYDSYRTPDSIKREEWNQFRFKDKTPATLFRTNGVLYDFSNLSDKQFFDMIYCLDRGIEISYHRVVTEITTVKGEKVLANVYIPIMADSLKSFFTKA